MKIFETIQKHYAILGISPLDQSTRKYLFNERTLSGFLIIGCLITLNFVYIFQVADGFMEYVEGFCAASASIIIFVCFAAIAIRKIALFETIDNLEKLIDTSCKDPKSKRFFLQTNRQVERVSGIVFKVVVKIALQFMILPKCINSFAVYFIADSGADSFELPLPLWFPFDSNNPIGYSIAVILEYIILGYSYFAIACALSFGIGIFWFIVSTTKELQRILHSINDKVKVKKNKTNDFKALFSEYVHAHAVIKQVENDASDIFQPIMMSLFTWSLLAISVAMFVIQVELLHHEDIIPMLVWVLNGIFAFTTVLIACEIGQRMGNAFEEIEFAIDQFDWYMFPIKIKQILPIIIVLAQQPVELECFGGITCTREVFKNVVHRAYSYFMVLRQLGL